MVAPRTQAFLQLRRSGFGEVVVGNTEPCTEELLEGFYFQPEEPWRSTGPETGDGAFGKRKETG